MNWLIFSVITQFIFIIYFSITHWIPLFPWNDIRKEGIFKAERIGVVVHNILQIFSISSYYMEWKPGMWVGLIYWSILFTFHILEWWIVYFFGWPTFFVKTTKEASATTYKFLPPIKNHPIPDACHFFIGILAISVVISIYIYNFYFLFHS